MVGAELAEDVTRVCDGVQAGGHADRILVEVLRREGESHRLQRLVLHELLLNRLRRQLVEAPGTHADEEPAALADVLAHHTSPANDDRGEEE